jgi:hypothetical protein
MQPASLWPELKGLEAIIGISPNEVLIAGRASDQREPTAGKRSIQQSIEMVDVASGYVNVGR